MADVVLGKRDLLPNHGWFPKFFQNIFFLKSKKRMLPEIKKELCMDKDSCSKLIKTDTEQKRKTPSTETGTDNQSSAGRQAAADWTVLSRVLWLGTLTCRSCRGRSSSKSCSSRAGNRTREMSDTAPEDQRLFYSRDQSLITSDNM